MNGPHLLKSWRTAAGITQTAAAEKLGVRPATWSEWESGQRGAGRDHAVMLENLTDGAVPLESWSKDAAVGEAMAQNIARRRHDTPVPGAIDDGRDSVTGAVV